jgi:hypothetical protein
LTAAPNAPELGLVPGLTPIGFRAPISTRAEFRALS